MASDDDLVHEIESLTDAALGRPLMRVVPPSDRRALRFELDNVATHFAVDQLPERHGRGAAMKRAMLRLNAFSWARQRAVNHSLHQAVRYVVAELDELRSAATAAEARGAVARAAASASFDAVHDLVARLTAKTDELSLAVDAATQRLDRLSDLVASHDVGLRSELKVEQRRITMLKSEISQVRRGSPAQSNDTGAPAAADTALAYFDQEIGDLYERLEATFRPSGDELDSRLAEYLDDLAPLRDGTLKLLDIGSGRGDFIQLVRRNGMMASGIDLSPAAVQAAVERGLDVRQGDALEFLGSLPSASLGAVSALHVVEHIDPAICLTLIDEIFRVLVPGGVLILETPNPTNVLVGAASFYNDPTHVRPVPPVYLEFLVADRGFCDVQLRFLHPLPQYDVPIAFDEHSTPAGMKALIDDVRWALRGPQDYAIVAHRPAST